MCFLAVPPSFNGKRFDVGKQTCIKQNDKKKSKLQKCS